MTEKKPSRAVSAATKEIEKLHAAERAMQIDLTALRGELADVMPAAASATADAYLSGDSSSAGPVGTARAVELNAKIDALSAAIDETRSRRVTAIRTLFEAEAADLNAQAGKLKHEADRRQKRTEELLDDLAEHEGVRYQPPAPTLLAILEDGRPWYESAPLPKTAMLREQAAGLEARARASRELVMGGACQADTPDELIVVACGDPLAIGPREDELLGWADQAAETERERRRKIPGPNYVGYVPGGEDAPLHFSIQWAGGELVEKHCGCTSPGAKS